MNISKVIAAIKNRLFEPGPVWSAMTFGEAIEAMKKGHAVRRVGWNGKGMVVYMNTGSMDQIPEDRSKTVNGVPARFFERGDTGTDTRMPNLRMRAADKTIVNGWLASQTDMLAEDWEVIL